MDYSILYNNMNTANSTANHDISACIIENELDDNVSIKTTTTTEEIDVEEELDHIEEEEYTHEDPPLIPFPIVRVGLFVIPMLLIGYTAQKFFEKTRFFANK